MSKPRAIPVPEAEEPFRRENKNEGRQQEPLSGSKKVKQQNHSRHNNGEG
ncbi:small acid-soluble spore protein P [Paenibacillus tarimensis]